MPPSSIEEDLDGLMKRPIDLFSLAEHSNRTWTLNTARLVHSVIGLPKGNLAWFDVTSIKHLPGHSGATRPLIQTLWCFVTFQMSDAVLGCNI